MDLEQLVGEARERELKPMPGRERVVAGVSAVLFLAAASFVVVAAPSNRPLDIPLIAVLVALLAVARRVRFEIGNGEACPEQLVLMPILFLAPLKVVALVVMAGFLLARLPDFAKGTMHPDRWLYPVADSWPIIGAVAALAALAPGRLDAHHLGVYVLVLAAQLAAGLVTSSIQDYLIHGTPTRDALSLMLWVYRIDAVLTPVAYMSAAVASRAPVAVLAVAPLLWLLHAFSVERKERYAAALELNQAYRGTVMVLSDVVEAEDNYTASHCRSVVELAAAVADELGLDRATRQELEITALLHDVGKIAIPNEILNKPAKLTAEEFELMKTHTVEGQALLDRVGGRLARVGKLVRSCHERWDGNGYPDGLAGEQIPIAARVVFCCDAYSAMTTDRPYRSALSPAVALKELSRNAGTQFEPRIVAAMEKVAHAQHASTVSYTDALRAVLAGNSLPALELSS
jgi:HD-GYP domain-containing protein (c-di-GMP phosphodiesterase class II)